MQPPPPVERAVLVRGYELGWECREILKARRRRSVEELRDSSDERFFDFFGDGGNELRNLFDDKSTWSSGSMGQRSRQSIGTVKTLNCHWSRLEVLG